MISDFTDEKLDIFTKLFDITETTKLVSTIVTNDMKSRFQMNYAIEIWLFMYQKLVGFNKRKSSTSYRKFKGFIYDHGAHSRWWL